MASDVASADFEQFGLDQWLEHIQRQHWRTIELKLDRIREVWIRMEGQRAPLVITVAGTNGKGSCVAMLEAALRQSGMKTGSYTSPHLVRYNERVCINGEAVNDDLLNDAFLEIERSRGDIPLTYFEFGTLCALRIFEQQKVDACVLETGMGGRLDAVNLVTNDIALITSVGLDHEQWLGSDRESIGREKAGIVNDGGLVVCADPDPPATIEEVARSKGATLVQAGRDYSMGIQDERQVRFRSDHPGLNSEWHDIDGLTPPFRGQHQVQNLGCVVAALGCIAERFGLVPACLEGIADARVDGRCQVVNHAPLVIVDVAHNADSAFHLGEALREMPVDGHRYAVFGVLEDKALAPIVGQLGAQTDSWLLATLEGERGQTAEVLQGKMLIVLPEAETSCHDSPAAALTAALEQARPVDRIVVFGSFFTVGGILPLIKERFSGSG